MNIHSFPHVVLLQSEIKMDLIVFYVTDLLKIVHNNNKKYIIINKYIFINKAKNMNCICFNHFGFED